MLSRKKIYFAHFRTGRFDQVNISAAPSKIWSRMETRWCNGSLPREALAMASIESIFFVTQTNWGLNSYLRNETTEDAKYSELRSSFEIIWRDKSCKSTRDQPSRTYGGGSSRVLCTPQVNQASPDNPVSHGPIRIYSWTLGHCRKSADQSVPWGIHEHKTIWGFVWARNWV